MYFDYMDFVIFSPQLLINATRTLLKAGVEVGGVEATVPPTKSAPHCRDGMDGRCNTSKEMKWGGRVGV